MRAPVFIDSSASFRVNPSCQIPPRRQCVLGNRWFLWLSKAQYPDMRLRSPSWALIDQRGYQPSLRREDPSLLWRFEAGAGVRSQNAEDHDGGFCFLPCGLVEPPSWDRREMRRDLRPPPPLGRACPPSFALGNVCSHSPPITSLDIAIPSLSNPGL